MALVKDYKSNLFRSMPDNSGHLAIHVTETRCTIGVCSDSGILTLLRSISRPTETFVHDFVRTIFEKYERLITKKFTTATVGIGTSNFTLLPQADNIEPENLINFLTGSPTRVTHVDTIKELESNFIYSIPKLLNEVLTNNLPAYQLVSTTRLAIQQALSRLDNCIIIFEDNFFDCITIKDKKLYSVNRHNFETPEDIVYFIALSLNDAELSTEEAKITVTGTIKKHSPEFNLMYRYFKYIELKPLTTKIIIRPDFGSPQHEFQNILNILDANY